MRHYANLLTQFEILKVSFIGKLFNQKNQAKMYSTYKKSMITIVFRRISNIFLISDQIQN